MKRGFALMLLALVLLSCTPQKQLHRLLKKHPHLAFNDTILINDSIFFETLRTDTLFRWSLISDTVTIYKDKLKVQLVKKNDTVYLSGEYMGDTIIIERKIPVEKIVYRKQAVNILKIFNRLIILAAMVSICLMVLRYFKT